MNMKVWLATALLATAFLATSVAEAKPVIYCRDCPFPAKISEGRWIMPSGRYIIDITETGLPKGMNQVDVILRDAKNGEIIARGRVLQRRERRTAYVDLIDTDGRPIDGFIRFVDGEDREKIQVKFTCEGCSIAPLLE
jgi:hypothetical protein